MSTPQKKLKNEAKKFLSIKDLFPRSKPDFRRKLTKYQERKIKAAITEIKEIGGAHSTQIVPIGTGRKNYLAERGYPSYMRGEFMSGGAKVNKNVKYIKGEFYYERGGKPRTRMELDTSGTVEDLLNSADYVLKRRKNRTTALTANGRVIGMAQNMRTNDIIKSQASFIFLKYSEMADNGEYRKHNGALTKAAHPAEWGIGILFEKGGQAATERDKGKKSRKGKFVTRPKFDKAYYESLGIKKK